MNDSQKAGGRLTIPTDVDVVDATLNLMKRWGADALRDCDGTDFPQALREVDAKIYSTYYTTRKDNAWAKAHPEEVQQCYIMTGFYTARTELDPQTLIQQLKERLPSYMIPAQLVQIPSMPITQNGKVDIPALRHMDVKPLQKTEPAAAPDSKTEAALLTLCRELFENPDITPEDDFFVMGGNSITAIRLLSRIRQQFGVTLTIYDILNTPQINQWAALIDQPV